MIDKKLKSTEITAGLVICKSIILAPAACTVIIMQTSLCILMTYQALTVTVESDFVLFLK